MLTFSQYDWLAASCMVAFFVFSFLSVVQAWFILFRNFDLKTKDPWQGVGIYSVAIFLSCFLVFILRLIMAVSGDSSIFTYIFVCLVLTASFGLILANFIINPDDLTSMIMIGVHFVFGQAIGCVAAYAVGNK